MSKLNIVLHAHQPYRIRKFRIFDIGQGEDYFNDDSESDLNNDYALEQAIENTYTPTNEALLSLLNSNPEFRFSLSITGTLLTQLAESYPHVLTSFTRLVDTGRVELISETSHHSLAFLYSVPEFINQVKAQNQLIKDIFGVTPKFFRNTEQIFSDDLAQTVAELGFSGVLTSANSQALDGVSPHQQFSAAGTELSLLVSDNDLVSGIRAHLVSARSNKHKVKTVPLLSGVNSALTNPESKLVTVSLDYDDLREQSWNQIGIRHMLLTLPEAIANGVKFTRVSDSLNHIASAVELDVPKYISWCEIGQDLSSWQSNRMQKEALQKLFDLETKVMQTGDLELIEDWRKLQTSDHFYYMCTHWHEQNQVELHFSPYESPYDAFISFMNVIEDLNTRLTPPKPQEREIEIDIQLLTKS